MAGRLRELDGLRGIAATGILVMHVFPASLFWAWNFVDLFFVLSGFLITGILLRLDLRSPLALRNFWVRRIIRIWPVYYLALLFALAIWSLYPAAWPTPWWRCFAFLQFTEHYGDLAEPEAQVAAYVPWFRHSWSLAVEEQYYLAWPLVLFVLRKNRAALLAVCVALLAIAFALRREGQLVVLLATRADGLALGSILALLRRDPAGGDAGLARWRPCLYAALALALAWIVPYVWVGYAQHLVRNYTDIGRYGDWSVLVIAFAVLHFALVALLVDGALPRFAALLRAPALLHLGALSYAIYMYSGPVPELLRRIERHVSLDAPLLWSLAAIMATLLAAQLSRSLVERPLEQLKPRFPLNA